MTDDKGDPSAGAVERLGSNSNDHELDRLAARLLKGISEEPGEGNGYVDVPVVLSEKYRGPFTHPDILKELDGVVKDGAERAFRLTEIEQQFRHDSVRKMLDSEIKERDKAATDRRIVIIFVFVFLTLCLAGAFAAVMTGHNTGAGLVAGAGAVISAAALLINRLAGRKQQEGKS